MDTFLGLSATGWTAIYTILTALLVLMAFVAADYAKGQWDAGREQLEESRRANREATRPYVICQRPRETAR